MLRLANIFLAAALSAAFFGFTRVGLAVGITETIQILFGILLALFFLFLMLGFARKTRQSKKAKIEIRNGQDNIANQNYQHHL